MGLIAQVTLAFGGQKKITDYFNPGRRQETVTQAVKQGEKGFAQNDFSELEPCPGEGKSPDITQFEALPADVLVEVVSCLDIASRAQFACLCKEAEATVARVQLLEVRRDLAQMAMLKLPEVTQDDVDSLQRIGVKTQIVAPMPSFKISNTPITIGLYHAVMGCYPDLSRNIWRLFPAAMKKQLKRWEADQNLPLTHTTLAEDQEFIARLNQITGRRFRLPTDSEVEYSIRGRVVDQETGEMGLITSTAYHFGNHRRELLSRAWFIDNSDNRVHGVREAISGRTIDDSKNSFGLIHPIGNVSIRSATGVVHGGSFCEEYGHMQSSLWSSGYAAHRSEYVGARFVEDVQK